MFDYYNPLAHLGNPNQKLTDYQFTMAGFRPRGGTMPVQAPAPQQMMNNNNGMFGDPFGTAMSGTKSGTLQPFINRNTQLANNALYGGLLGYQPQQLMAGDAGGTPVSPTPPQFNLPSAIPQDQQGLLGGFGKRAWMEG
jgi:hypothetical protein